jgi:RNA polymerase sigma-70 factor (ECF subfamily)
LIKALRQVRPQTPRQFFKLANQHILWELNDLCRRLDKTPALMEFIDAPARESSDSGLTLNARRILDAIEKLPDDEREAFELVRIQGMTYGEAAEVAGVVAKTMQRRLGSALLTLTKELADLAPVESGPEESEVATSESAEQESRDDHRGA